jgi:hypothetical protein
MLLLGMYSAGPAAAAGSYDLLATEILTSSQASVTFSSLGTYAADYQHLQIRSVAYGGYSYIRFNGDSASNYSAHYLRGNGSGVASGYATTSYPSGIVSLFLADNTTANSFAAQVTDILDPFNTSKYTTTRGLGGFASSDPRIGLESGSWRNTASLTSIEIRQITGSFLTGSRFSLYGLRKAA